MRHGFTAVFEKDQEWVIAYCDGLRGVPDDAERETILVEIPGAA